LKNTYKNIFCIVNIIETNFSNLSKLLTKKLDINEKKKDGIYFTPLNIINIHIKLLEPFIKNIKDVLEPSCGSCECILKLNNIFLNLNITGIELNKTIFESIKDLEKDNISLIELNKTIFESIKDLEKDNISLINANYLTHNFDKKFDLIIGNPPYFIMKKADVDNSYYNYFGNNAINTSELKL